jgi:hypothetical protein
MTSDTSSKDHASIVNSLWLINGVMLILIMIVFLLSLRIMILNDKISELNRKETCVQSVKSSIDQRFFDLFKKSYDHSA